MNRRLIFRRQAQRDLAAITTTIAVERPAVARRFLRATRKVCDILATSPELGQSYVSDSNDLALLRYSTIAGFRKYVIFYRATRNEVEVVRILHGSRDVDSALQAD